MITGSRAEYGLFYPLLRQLKGDSDIRLQIVVSGMHLSPAFGSTFREIEQDGFHIDEKVDMLLNDNSSAGIAKSMGKGMVGFATALSRLRPDLVLLLGDRFEIFSAAAVCHTMNIPVAHFYGGDITEGAIDDAFRHSITKLSLLHFVSTEEYRRRVIQLGESPRRVFNVGALGIDNIHSEKLLGKSQIEKKLGFKFGSTNVLVTFHPVTLCSDSSVRQCRELLMAISEFPDYKFIFTAPNADAEGREILGLIGSHVKTHRDSSVYFPSLGRLLYLSMLKHSDLVLGNSSSGIVEAPSFGVPTVNIGSRQKGRVKSDSVVDCDADRGLIVRAIRMALSASFRKKCLKVENPYGDGRTAARAMKRLKIYLAAPFGTIKRFHDIPV